MEIYIYKERMEEWERLGIVWVRDGVSSGMVSRVMGFSLRLSKGE